MKFRKKPVVIEAERYLDLGHPFHKEIDGVVLGYGGKSYIETLEGNMEVMPGDWVITGVKGEKYPCKPDIFELTYEEVTEKAPGWESGCNECGNII